MTFWCPLQRALLTVAGWKVCVRSDYWYDDPLHNKLARNKLRGVQKYVLLHFTSIHIPNLLIHIEPIQLLKLYLFDSELIKHVGSFPTFDRTASSRQGMARIARPIGCSRLRGQTLQPNIKQLNDWKILNGEAFFAFASGMLKWIPTEDVGGKEIYSIFCVFYSIFYQDPINKFRTAIDTTSIGKPLTYLSAWMVQEVGKLMSTPESLTFLSYQAFIDSPRFTLDEAEVPAEGFQNFNQLFARPLKKGVHTPYQLSRRRQSYRFPSGFDLWRQMRYQYQW